MEEALDRTARQDRLAAIRREPACHVRRAEYFLVAIILGNQARHTRVAGPTATRAPAATTRIRAMQHRRAHSGAGILEATGTAAMVVPAAVVATAAAATAAAATAVDTAAAPTVAELAAVAIVAAVVEAAVAVVVTAAAVATAVAPPVVVTAAAAEAIQVRAGSPL